MHLKYSPPSYFLFRPWYNFKLGVVRFLQNFVPAHEVASDSDVSYFYSFLVENKPCLVVTGAGISTESGIPDYRSEGVGLYASSTSRPVIFKDFLSSNQIRQRYWARNFVGWPAFSMKNPNVTHRSLADLENRNFLTCIVTQNVDRLHRKAGSEKVIELHGSTYKVICLECDYSIDRHAFQQQLQTMNPTFSVTVGAGVNPDGDVTLPQGLTDDFIVPQCPRCRGILKPDIVFFGDNVPSNRSKQVKEEVESCNSVIVLGSSLTVYSSFRIILQAADLKKPILIVNIGPTRGDNLAELKLNVRCGEIFERTKELIAE